MTQASSQELCRAGRVSSSRPERISLCAGVLALCAGSLWACGKDESLAGMGREWDDRQSGGTGGKPGTPAHVPSLVSATGGGGAAPDAGGGSGAADAGTDVEPEAGNDARTDADMPPDGPPVCGDGWRDIVTEECDDGVQSGPDSCDDQCRVRDVLIGPNQPGDGPLRPPGRKLGAGRHTIAAGAAGFAVVFVEHQQDPISVNLRAFERNGAAAGGAVNLNDSWTALDDSDPVVAALPDGKYAVAWTELGGDGDETGIAFRVIDAATSTLGTLDFANAGRARGQRQPDIVASDTEIVVAWTDDAAFAATGSDLRYRRFSLSGTALVQADETLAATAAFEDGVTLTRFQGGWAAAWIAADSTGQWIGAKAGNTEWSIGPVDLTNAEGPVALAEIDATHLFVAFVAMTNGNASIAEAPRLHWAVLDTDAPGATPWVALEPTAEPQPVDLQIDHSWPDVVRIGGSLYVAWRSRTPAGDPGDTWLKKIDVASGGSGTTLDFNTPEMSIPRWEEHRLGDQGRPVLAATTVRGSPALVTAWDDLARTFGAGAGAPDVVLQLMPVPMLRSSSPEVGR